MDCVFERQNAKIKLGAGGRACCQRILNDVAIPPAGTHCSSPRSEWRVNGKLSTEGQTLSRESTGGVGTQGAGVLG